MEGIISIDAFVPDSEMLFRNLNDSMIWDDRMTARKTASYGVAYNYSQMSYPYHPMLTALGQLCADLNTVIGFEPNNCLINYYPDGNSKMGFHSDNVDILETGTGVAIVSLGASRVLRFRKIEDKSEIVDYELLPGSLFYMRQSVQHEWEHSIPKSDVKDARISLTFRKILSAKT